MKAFLVNGQSRRCIMRTCCSDSDIAGVSFISSRRLGVVQMFPKQRSVSLSIYRRISQGA